MGKHRVKLNADCLDCELDGARCYTCRATATRLASEKATRQWARKANRAFHERLNGALGPLKREVD